MQSSFIVLIRIERNIFSKIISKATWENNRGVCYSPLYITYLNKYKIYIEDKEWDSYPSYTYIVLLPK